MSKKDEALKLALEALNRNDYLGWQTNIHVRDAIREALAEQPAQQQEPAAEITAEDMGRPFNAIRIGTHFYKEVPPVGTKLYTSPPASKPWVGLTDEDLAGCDDEELKQARYWENKLKEKNAL